MREVHISTSRVGESAVVKVDGALTREGLTELEKVVPLREGPLRLDLSELRSLDEDGLAAIRALAEDGAEVVGASPYIALLIGPVAGILGNRR